MSKREIRISSFDGGGLRGTLEALVVREIEREMKKQIFELFDIVVGTSTGGIIAILLTIPTKNKKRPLTGKEIYEFYKKLRKIIFQKKGGINIFNSKYQQTQLELLIDELYDRDTTLKDAVIPVGITVAIGKQDTPFLLNSHMSAQNQFPHNLPIKDIILAISCAPSYFDPLEIEIPQSNIGDDGKDFYDSFSKLKALTHRKLTFTDGGILQNNPALLGLSYAEYLEKLGHKFERTTLVSFGTGELEETMIIDPGCYGTHDLGLLFNYVKDFINDPYKIDQKSLEVHLKLSQMTSNDFKYTRLQGKFGHEIPKLDDHSDEALKKFQISAEKLFETIDFRRTIENLQANRQRNFEILHNPQVYHLAAEDLVVNSLAVDYSRKEKLLLVYNLFKGIFEKFSLDPIGALFTRFIKNSIKPWHISDDFEHFVSSYHPLPNILTISLTTLNTNNCLKNLAKVISLYYSLLQNDEINFEKNMKVFNQHLKEALNQIFNLCRRNPTLNIIFRISFLEMVLSQLKENLKEIFTKTIYISVMSSLETNCYYLNLNTIIKGWKPNMKIEGHEPWLKILVNEFHQSL